MNVEGMVMAELDLERLRAVRVLGRGAMGTVFLVADRSAPTSAQASLFALKVFDKRSPSLRPDADRRARWEVSVLSRLQGGHPNLPHLLAPPLETDDLLAWAVPYCPGGDLNALRYSLSDRVFSAAAIRFYLAELVAALAYLHSLGIVYRDLKPENVLVGADGHLVLTDFDLSRHLAPRKPPSAPSSPLPDPVVLPRRRSHRRNLTRALFGPAATAADLGGQLKKAKSARVSPFNRRRASFSNMAGGAFERSFSFVGTEEYVSPEVVRGEGHEFAVDWWALGILTYEMAYGQTPFSGRNRKETFRNVLTRQPEFPGRHRSDLTDLIARLLAKDPARRLGYAAGANEVRAHPFFQGLRWEMLGDVARPPFLPSLEDKLEEAVIGGDGGGAGELFDIREYYKRLHQPPSAPGSPLDPAESSLTEF